MAHLAITWAFGNQTIVVVHRDAVAHHELRQ
jgi:hypothetical protein